MRNSEIKIELAVLSAKGDLLRKLTSTRNIDAFLKVIDEEAATLTRETNDLNKRMQVITSEPRLTWPITCKQVPGTPQGEKLFYTIGNTYQMEVVGFLLFSVRDDTGSCLYTFNCQQIEEFFENNL